MIKIVNKLVMIVLVGAITSCVAFARETKKGVTFSDPVTVNGTLVKAGTYEAVFDDQTNELSIIKDGKVVAQAPAQLEKREERDHASYETREEEGNSGRSILVSVVLKGNNQVTLVNSGGSAQ